MSEVVTIVTGFVDINRGNWVGTVNGRPLDGFMQRDVETYLQRFERLTKVNNPIVCFIHSQYHERILKMRSDITLVAIDDILSDNIDLINRIKKVQQNEHFINYVTRPNVPEYWSPEYVLVTSYKSYFCNFAVKNNLNKTNTVAWIDFGYGRPETPIPDNFTWKYNTNGYIHLWCNTRTPIDKLPIYEIVRTGEVYIQGCHVVAPADKWEYMDKMFFESLNSLINIGMTDDDQTLFLMAYRQCPEIFDIHYVDPNSFWFMIFRDFHHE